MSPTLPVSPKRKVLAGLAVLALALGGFVAWWHWRSPVDSAELAAFLDKTEGGGHLRFTVDHFGTVRQGDGDLQVSVTATARPLEPLYSSVDAADYLKRTLQLDPESTAEARRVLDDRAASPLRGIMGDAPLPADPYRASILRLSAAAGAPFIFLGVIQGHRTNGDWILSLSSGAYDGARPDGDVRSSFPAVAFMAGDAGDDARLRMMAGDLKAFSVHLDEVHRSLELARAAATARRRAEFLGHIAPGQVFRGQAHERGEQQGTTLYLEIADVSPENEVTALLRNESSWRRARTFQGTWSADDEFQNPVLNLTSLPDQALRGAGPLLENTQSWAFALQVDPQGHLSERNAAFQYQFQPMNAADVDAAKARLEAEANAAFAATEPGSLFQGTAVSRATGASEPILLRFTGRSDGGEALEARLESASRSWKRPLRGEIMENSRRSGGEPVRLRTGAAEAVADAPPDSVLGARNDLELRLGLDGQSLAGEDAQFTYQLSPAGAADLRQLEADRAERARLFLGAFRDGIEFDGTMREEQGFVTRARLKVVRMDPKTGAIAARVASLVRPGVHRDFIGACDPGGSSAVLGTIDKGVLDTSGDFGLPFLVGPAPSTLHLTLSGTSISGTIVGDAHWEMDFPAAAFLAAPGEKGEPGSSVADYSPFPAFPVQKGAYVLSRGKWAALPRNNGHVVTESVKEKSDLELPSNLVDAVEKGINQLVKEKNRAKASYLEFDGKDPIPESSGAVLVLLLVGAELPGKMKVELAPADTLKEGQRRVQVEGDSPVKIRLSEQGAAVYVREGPQGALLVTTTSALASGPYVLNADGGYELRQE
ncbi:MAG TPA: hypothetical protein VII09_02320 [Opitutaceae bacterium]